jgi:hypothetical protein
MLFLGLDKLFWFWSFFETGLIVFIFWNRIDFLVWTNCFGFGHFLKQGIDCVHFLEED